MQLQQVDQRGVHVDSLHLFRYGCHAKFNQRNMSGINELRLQFFCSKDERLVAQAMVTRRYLSCPLTSTARQDDLREDRACLATGDWRERSDSINLSASRANRMTGLFSVR